LNLTMVPVCPAVPMQLMVYIFPPVLFDTE